MSQSQRSIGRSPLAVIFVTVFIDLVGFGMVIPLNPYLGSKYGATPLQVGLLISVYSLMQFIFSPVWGRMSDRIGRRPIILMSLLGSSLSYIGFAFATELWMLFAARIFAGIFAANISTAMAYIADVTSHENRSKNMGLIGAAFGLGFMFGPAFGGLLSQWGMQLGDAPPLGMGFSALGAALICFVNFLVAIGTLKESRDIGKGMVRPRHSRVKLVSRHLRRPVMGHLMIVFLLTGLGMAHMESALGLYVKDVFSWNLSQASYAFAYVGLMMVLTQGFLVRRLMPKVGERRLLVGGLFLAGLGIAAIAVSTTPVWLGLAVTILSLGTGLANPATLGSISLLGSADEQGEVMGVTQSLSAIGRIIGPALGGMFYGHVSQMAPFLVGGGLCFVGLGLVATLFDRLPNVGKASGAH